MSRALFSPSVATRSESPDPLTDQLRDSIDRLESAVAVLLETAKTGRGPYLTSKQAIRYLGLNSVGSLYNHIRNNKLPTCRVGGDLRFDTRELDAWMRGTNTLELVRSRKRSA